MRTRVPRGSASGLSIIFETSYTDPHCQTLVCGKGVNGVIALYARVSTGDKGQDPEAQTEVIYSEIMLDPLGDINQVR